MFGSRFYGPLIAFHMWHGLCFAISGMPIAILATTMGRAKKFTFSLAPSTDMWQGPRHRAGSEAKTATARSY